MTDHTRGHLSVGSEGVSQMVERYPGTLRLAY